MKNKAALSLWMRWLDAIWQLRPAFSRMSTFLWFVTAVSGLTVRTDMLGVTSIVRSLNLTPKHYRLLLDHFHSKAIKLDTLTALWARVVFRIFPKILRVNGKPVYVGDGTKAPKRGKKMPGVKLLHQQSQNKAEYTMGHSMQAVSVLVEAGNSVLAVPLAMRIHEGTVTSNRDKRTLLDRMLQLLGLVTHGHACYFVADAYYPSAKVIHGLAENGSHLVSRLKKNATAYEPHVQTGPRKRGRPKRYGKQIKLADIPKKSKRIQTITTHLYGEQMTLRVLVRDLLWKPIGRMVRIVNVIDSAGNSFLLICTDTSLDAAEIIRLYGLRFKIEHSFKQAVHKVGVFSYHFWMKDMTPNKYGGGDQYLHHKPKAYRLQVERKIGAYHAFLQASLIAQGLMQFLAATCPDLIWRSCGVWLRTIRPEVAPSEFVVANAMRHSLLEFLLSPENEHQLKKFITQRQELEALEPSQMAA